ncbi:hypothetical protein DTO027B5_4755 [Paecilomyces variotii]|nr:hypothetical protein DTO169C6_7312 [Paecilomyces variotii]KAJ9248070.1 hypothetical protein DTO195F2_8932 [Paecilomyces variotii]KAJ9322656.1 hypothetical protein DTO027B3_6238 [Paecilomyces variotii]KAJ9333385.1 hypothetical protein DTO027B5_4755 [Paecilomyces variotii]
MTMFSYATRLEGEAKFSRAPQPSRQVRIRKFGEIPTTDPAFSLFPDDYLFDIGGSRTREPPQEVESPSFGSTGFRDLLVRGENSRDNFTAVVVLPISTSTDARNVHP